ncbi:MAG: hypothetical protein QW561_04150, partial [Candidatus Aenigmatarchaeota archaeon]
MDNILKKFMRISKNSSRISSKYKILPIIIFLFIIYISVASAESEKRSIRIFGKWIKYGDGSVSINDEKIKWRENSYIYSEGIKVDWDLGSGTYIGSGVEVPSSISSTNKKNISFFMNVLQPMRIKIIIIDKGNEQYYCVKSLSSGSPRRINIAFGEFIKDPSYQPP